MRHQLVPLRHYHNLKEDNKHLQEELLKEDQELKDTRRLLGAKKQELEAVKTELEDTVENLQDTKQRLEEKKGLSQKLFKRIYKVEFSKDAEHVMKKLENAAKGLYEMKENDWKDLCNTIDRQHPEFHEEIINHLDEKFTDQQVYFCYLLKAGLTQTQIRNVLDMPKSTAWTWNERFKWISE